jgi:hypothetical protein
VHVKREMKGEKNAYLDEAKELLAVSVRVDGRQCYR